MGKFNSINELDSFDFRDCYICDIKTGDDLVLEIEALIIKSTNSQNTNFTDSYAGTAKLTLKNARIISGIKDGYRYYNADDVLITEKSDVELSGEEITEVLRNAKGMYLYGVEGAESGYELLIEEIDDSDYGTAGDSYSATVAAKDVEVSWDRYMNRVER